jgi:hypothetical protein
MLLPNLLIIGVTKGGTTTLYDILRTHPEICSPRMTKEIRYFYPAASGQPLAPIGDYGRYFTHCNPKARWRMEASPEYYAGGALIAVTMRKTLATDLKLLWILREPVSRFLSLWRYLITQMFLEKHVSLQVYFERCCTAKSTILLDYYNALETGKYALFFPAWSEIFGDNVKIVFLDDLQNRPSLCLADIAAWLNVPAEGFVLRGESNVTIGYKNAALHRIVLAARRRGKPIFERNVLIRKFFKRVYYALNGDRYPPDIDAGVVAELQRIYSPYNQELADLLRQHRYTQMPAWLDYT